MQTFRVARWAWSLRVTSTVATALAAVTSIVVFRVLSAYGVPIRLRLSAASVPLVAIGLAVPFAVTRYTLSQAALHIAHPFWSSSFPLEGFTDAWPDPTVLRPAKRVFGIAGLFSYSCLCKSRALGRFHFYGTAPSRAVVLFRPGSSIVITPDSTEDFLACLARTCPSITVRPKPPEA